jgi:hypothetical protein
VLRRVPHQVQQRLAQPLRVGAQRRAFGAALLNAKPVAEDGLRLRRRAVQEPVHWHRLQPQQRTVIHLGEGGQVLHEPAHERELVDERLLDGPHLHRAGPVLEHLEMPAADRDRRAQLVRDRRQERVLHLVQLAEPPGQVTLALQRHLDLFVPAHSPGDALADEHADRDRHRRGRQPGPEVAAHGEQGQDVGGRRQRGHGDGGPWRLRHPDPHEGDDKEKAVVVHVGAAERIAQSDQREGGRCDAKTCPPGPFLPGREPDRDAEDHRSRADHGHGGLIRPRGRQRQRDQAQRTGTGKEHPGQAAREPLPPPRPVLS